MDIYDVRKPLQPGIVVGNVYNCIRHKTNEVSIYLDTGYEIRISSAEFAYLSNFWHLKQKLNP